MIIKDGRMVVHAQYNKPLTEDEGKESIDFFINLMDSKIKPKESGGEK